MKCFGLICLSVGVCSYAMLAANETSADVIHGEITAVLDQTDVGGNGPYGADGSPAFVFDRVSNGSVTVTGGNGGDLEINLFDSSAVLASAADGFGLISTSENGRIRPGDTLPTYGTSALRRHGAAGAWEDRMTIIMSPSPAGGEYNSNTNFAYFPETEFIGGHYDDGSQSSVSAINLDANNGLIFGKGSPADPNGATFVDVGDGSYLVDYTTPASGSIDGATDGILLASSAKNEDNYAMSKVNGDGSFQILSADNGSGALENDDISWVYLPVGDPSTAALGRIDDEGDTIIGSGSFSITNTTAGEWFLSVAGVDPSLATLIVTGAAETTAAADNIVTFEPGTLASVDGWYIQSRDIPTGLPLESVGVDAPAFSFAVFAVPEPQSAVLLLCALPYALAASRRRLR